ncbi:MAG TPA: TraB/GumN family protein, partial [Sphingomicrobium sp.]|nr:TraB/GumN family protein [Sphingomicrobium sp.]
MIFSFLKRALAFAGLAIASLSPSQAVAATAKPALWEVSDPDTRIYLFGTIHLLPRNYAWKSRTIDKAIARSDTLVVETIIDTRNPRALAAELARLGFSRGLPPIANRIDPAKRPLLEAAIAKSGVPRNVFDQMETWAAAFTL